MMRWLVDKIIDFAQRRPFSGGHIYGEDGSCYMERYSIFESRLLNVRLHHIHRPDRDRHLHDHPWPWASVVLRGFYVEARPNSIDPCFNARGDAEDCAYYSRKPGSVTLRRATDRHRIASVSVFGAYTIFIHGRKCQWWGFHTPDGKVYHRNYGYRA